MKFSCNQCAQVSNRRYNLNKHIRRKHDGVGLIIEITKHFDQQGINRLKKHYCPFCPQRSNRNYNIIMHIKRKHSKNFESSQDFRFNTTHNQTNNSHFNPYSNRLQFKNSIKPKSKFAKFLNFYQTVMLYHAFMNKFQPFIPYINPQDSSTFQNINSTTPSIKVYDDILNTKVLTFEFLQPELDKLNSLLQPHDNIDLFDFNNQNNTIPEIKNSEKIDSNHKLNENKINNNSNEILDDKQFIKIFEEGLIIMAINRVLSKSLNNFSIKLIH